MLRDSHNIHWRVVPYVMGGRIGTFPRPSPGGGGEGEGRNAISCLYKAPIGGWYLSHLPFCFFEIQVFLFSLRVSRALQSPCLDKSSNFLSALQGEGSSWVDVRAIGECRLGFSSWGRSCCLLILSVGHCRFNPTFLLWMACRPLG